MKLNKLMMGIAAAAVATVALATVTFNPTTGTGFVGKGDVQTAFVWNNAQLQQRLSGVTFKFNQLETSTITCTWYTGQNDDNVHTMTKNRSVGVAGTVAYDPRVRNQITGINLTGYVGAVTEVDTLDGGPWSTIVNVGDPCPGNEGNGKYVSAITVTSSSIGLYAIYNGVSKLIWPPVVAPTI